MDPTALLLLIFGCVALFIVLIAYDHYLTSPILIINPSVNMSLLWSFASIGDLFFYQGFAPTELPF